MKKAVIFATALATVTMCTPVVTNASGENQTAGAVNVKVISKENCQEWMEQLKEGTVFGECYKWGGIYWQSECPTFPECSPEESPIIPETPDNAEKPEDSETPDNTNKPEDTENPDNTNKPEDSETPDGTNKPDSSETPDTPEVPSTPETPSTPEQTPSEDETANQTYAQQVVTLVNKERAKEGLAPLTIDDKITTAANVRAKEIQTSFSHTRPNGTSFSTAMKEAGVTYRSAGENIAWGQKTPEEVVNAWMNSSGHRANIMNANYTRIGVGHLQNSAGTSYWVQLFAN